MANTEEHECWKDISGYEGLYQASNLGRVRSLSRRMHNYTKPGRILKQGNNGHGYYNVSLHKEGVIAKHVYVHILVAKAFLENPNHYKEVNHKDFNKANNAVENLEWVSREQNHAHYRKSKYAIMVEKGRQGTLRGKWAKKVLQHKHPIIASYSSGLSIEEVSKRLGISKDFVADVLRICDVIPCNINNEVD